MHKIYTFVLIVISFFSSLFPSNTIPQETVEFKPVLRFMACSDTHINGYDDIKLDRIVRAVNYSYTVAENDESYSSLDAVIFAGDLTDEGKDEQFDAFEKTVKGAVKGNTKILSIVAKAHDSSQSKKSIEYCKQINGTDADYHVVINGFHFIGLSTSDVEGKNHNMKQRFWLEKQLISASSEDPNKPIFITHHEHVINTVYGSDKKADGWGDSSFKDIIAQYPQVVDISGHSHYPLNDPRSIWQGAFTAIGTGSMFYMEFTVDGKNSIHTDDGANNAQAWIIEVDAANRVRLRGFDVYHEKWLCEYLISNPSNVLSRPYSPKNQKALSSAPVFNENASIAAEKVDNKMVVSVPQASSTDGKPIFIYRVFVTDKDGNEIYSAYKLNNYWTVDLYKQISFEIDYIVGSKVEIVAENCYYMQSQSLTYIVK